MQQQLKKVKQKYIKFDKISVVKLKRKNYVQMINKTFSKAKSIKKVIKTIFITKTHVMTHIQYVFEQSSSKSSIHYENKNNVYYFFEFKIIQA